MLVGQQIGPFEVEKELGSGAMGAVYQARYTKTGQRVAIKVIAPGLGSSDRVQARFEREANVLKQLKHPNIVRLFAIGKFQGTPYYAMEYIEGETLADLLHRRGRLPWDEVVEIGKQLGAALQHAHANGIVHRDIKPSNVMLTRDGTVKLTDFGIAKDLDVTQLTSANCTVGTAAYMSPEQCRGERELTHKSDLYSFGILLYELLTGRKPFLADSALEMFQLHIKGKFERPSRHALDIPVWLDTLVCQLLEKKPDQRPVDAAMVAQVLHEVREKVETLQSAGVDVARVVSRHGKDARDKKAATNLLKAKKKRRKQQASRQWATWAKAGLLSLALLGLIGLLMFALRPKSPEKQYAEAVKFVQRGEAALAGGDSDAAQIAWYDADDRLGAIAGNPEHPFAEQAREQLTHVRAGTLFIKVNRFLADKKDWDAIKEDQGFEEFQKQYGDLLENYPAGDPFVEKVRAALQPKEAPELLDEGKKLAPLDDHRKWPEARRLLTQLVRRYPASEQAREGRLILERLEAHQSALTRLDAAKKAGGRRAASLSDAEETALQALEYEQAKEMEQARARWLKLQALGKQSGIPIPGRKPPMDDPEVRPWVLLAEEKLRVQKK
jgi:predicted Ser/Thr protein kinase